MALWRCSTCGYTLVDDLPPLACSLCHETWEFIDNICYTPDRERENIDKRG